MDFQSRYRTRDQGLGIPKILHKHQRGFVGVLAISIRESLVLTKEEIFYSIMVMSVHELQVADYSPKEN